MEKKILAEIAKCLKVKNAKTGMEKEKVTVDVGGKKTSGFVCGVLSLVRSQEDDLEGATTLERCLAHDWLTYCTTHLFHCQTQEHFSRCLKYIDDELVSRSYLCGHATTVADFVVFFVLHPFVSGWTYLQKEKYVNISRWFNSVQNNVLLTKTPVQFSRTLLYEEASRLRIC